ncbi:hypothetical protein ACWD45_32455 [Streptomyces rubiginosohelvolus]
MSTAPLTPVDSAARNLAATLARHPEHLAEQFNCFELDELLDLFAAIGSTEAAEAWIQHHEGEPECEGHTVPDAPAPAALERPLVDTSADGLAYAALNDDVEAVVTAHGEPERPAAGHRITLALDGTVTVHVNAADVPAAQTALEEISHEDFDIDLTTRDGHVIGHITLGDANGAELVSIDDVPTDELANNSEDGHDNCFGAHVTADGYVL